MSRQHYVAVAAVLAGDRACAANDAERRLIDNIARSLAQVFRRDNPSFDYDRFYEAVGVEQR